MGLQTFQLLLRPVDDSDSVLLRCCGVIGTGTEFVLTNRNHFRIRIICFINGISFISLPVCIWNLNWHRFG